MSDEPINLTEASYEELKAQKEKLEKLNVERDTKLAQDYGKAMNPFTYFNIRLNALIQVLLDGRGQMKLEILTQGILSHALDSLLKEAEEAKQVEEAEKARNTLLEGVSVAPSSFLG